ncbi:type II secretion system protein [Salarchaeum sp. JOR-1]|uniref:type II secretion system protein n=1 Tax=Salarchaeum sp. JOR-1 TaxID=2599399 RepID=UPI001198CAEE|nr:type II secretion system protein [Salarchaeum sp. JOR-1]QDX39796.1 type II secretion system protein [Salarchaeum sp. JOR-1]
MTLLDRVAALVPISAGGDPELDRALALLDRPEDADTVRTAALAFAALSVGSALALSVVASPTLGLAVLALGSLAAAALLALPTLAADSQRSRALGDGPDLVCRAVLAGALEPTPEHTAAFAADAPGSLADRLAGHVRYAIGAPTTAWTRFRRAWRDHDPELARAIALVEAATNAPDSERARLLDRALSVSLDAVAARVTDYASTLSTLVTGVYAAGVVLPLALVGLLPVAPVSGISVPLVGLAAVYDLALPIALTAAIAVVLARRPAAFPATPIPRDHPALAGRARPGLLWAIAAATGALVAFAVFAPWALPFAPVVGLGTGLVRWTRPVLGVREDIAALERGLPDALVVVGQHVRRGHPPEGALAAAAAELDGTVSTVFADASRLQRTLTADTRTAFLGPHGALRDHPSPRARSTAAVLADAAAAGPPGGRVLVALADHLDRLVRVERDTTADLASVTNALDTTGRWVAPCVAGVTAALARTLRPLGDGALPYAPDALALVVGGYVVALAVLLPAFGSVVRHGADRARAANAAGSALAVAGLVYPVVATAAALVTSV